MKKLFSLTIIGATLIIQLTGCIAPPVVGVPVAPGIPPGVVYVAPTYVSPGPGYLWNYNINYGWGWHHPRNGWHRGWR